MGQFVWIVFSLLCVWYVHSANPFWYVWVEQEFKYHKIVPDLIDHAPKKKVIVEYGKKSVRLGNTLKQGKVVNAPSVFLKKLTNEYYTLAMMDPDAPSRKNPTERSFNHWLVGNVFEGQVQSGDILAEYIGPQPPSGSGFHRYTFLVYKQDSKLEFNETRLTTTDFEERKRFSMQGFANKYNLGNPIRGNFFFAQYEN